MNCFEFNWDLIYGRNNTIIVGEALDHKPLTGYTGKMVGFFIAINSAKTGL